MKQNVKPTKIFLRHSEKKSERTYYSELFAKYKNYIKNTWNIINDVIGNTKYKWKDLPEKNNDK